MKKMDELVTLMKKAEVKAKDEKCCKTIKTILAIVGVIVVVAAIAFAVYKFVTKCRKNKEVCDCEETFEDEDSCIQLEFSYPEEAAEENAATAEVQTEEE
ncbi:MAG: DUF4366 domain-containing protein [Lachnospiraceae bacterium]|nr:DUF4366 domain-containing protein [Lachnospiraceae bacterium]